MSTKDNGGPAFPPTHDPETHAFGMTLRDYFAGLAIQGMCAAFPNVMKTDLLAFTQAMPETAYEIADAMLKARRS